MNSSFKPGVRSPQVTLPLRTDNSPVVLVVDDDPAMRVALSESLKSMGYLAQTASSAEEALAQLNEKPVGAVLTDMKMGGMSGIDLFNNTTFPS